MTLIGRLYSAKLWQGKALANLANSNKFTKVLLCQISLSKIFTGSVTISVKILCKHVLA